MAFVPRIVSLALSLAVSVCLVDISGHNQAKSGNNNNGGDDAVFSGCQMKVCKGCSVQTVQR